ncbi:MAG: hypothetical protein HZC28_19485 [Spirochaetes bacterium]|nr:hypothetical protein [Spirochaetota bacterium]
MEQAVTYETGHAADESITDILSSRDYLTEILAKDLEQKLDVLDEENNMLLYALAGISRNSENPINIVTSSSSSSGKSFTMKTALSLLPEGSVIQLSSATKQSFFYAHPDTYTGKVLFIEEADGLKSVLYSIRIMASEGVLSLQTVGMNDKGERIGQTKQINTRLAIMLSTTDATIKLDDETRNRFLVLSGNESTELTAKIIQRNIEKHSLSRSKYHDERKKTIDKHRAFLSAFNPIKVYCENISPEDIYLNSTDIVSRRRITPYLSVIKTIAYTRQYQRQIYHDGDTEYILTAREDIELANRLLKDLFSKEQEPLTGMTKTFYEALLSFVNDNRKDIPYKDFLFTERSVRESLRTWGNTQVFYYLKELERLGFIVRINGR